MNKLSFKLHANNAQNTNDNILKTQGCLDLQDLSTDYFNSEIFSHVFLSSILFHIEHGKQQDAGILYICLS